MTIRQEFPRAVRVAVIRRAGVSGVIICEKCGGFAKRFQIDHVVADSHGGQPTIENAMLICEACYLTKNATDTTIAAKLKRIEARHIGAKGIRSRGFPPAPEKIRPHTKFVAGRSALARQIAEVE